jgi:transcriptional regulator with XRE-family HTH domain
MSKIFSNLKFLRLQKGLSQEQMAESLGITRSRLGAYEENRNEPSIDLLITISDFFHIAVDALVEAILVKQT